MRIAISVAVAGLAVAAAACGGDAGSPAESTPGPTQTAAGGTPEATVELAPQPDIVQDLVEEVTEPIDGVIEVEIVDNFYVQNNLKAPLDETVTIRATNTGIAVHNLRLAGVDGRYYTDDDFVTAETGQRPGESGEFEFTPTIPGSYVFRCDFHPTEEGGVIVVE